MLFDIISFVSGSISGAVLTVSSTAVYNWVKKQKTSVVNAIEKAVPAVGTVANTVTAVETTANTVATSIDSVIASAASHSAGLKSAAASLASLVAKL